MMTNNPEEPEYSDEELAAVAQKEADLLGVEHSSYGCIGCDICTRRTMLEIISLRLHDPDEEA